MPEVKPKGHDRALAQPPVPLPDPIDGPAQMVSPNDEAASADREHPDPQPALGDLARAALSFNARVAQAGPRTELAVSRFPKYLQWGQEALAKSIHGGGKDAAATCALYLGLSLLREFPGLADICAARARVVPRSDPEAMDWFERFGTVDADTGGAGTLDKAYRRSIPERLAKELGLLAGDLGMPVSHLAILALMAAHLGTKGYVAPRYQSCIVITLRRFLDALARRSVRAKAYADAAPATEKLDTHDYSMADVLGPRSV
jgi:hypothetical protein